MLKLRGVATYDAVLEIDQRAHLHLPPRVIHFLHLTRVIDL